jgi:hypothetical protein
MAATVTARTSAPARRAPARRPASRRRRSGHTPISGFVPVAAAAGAVGGIADSGIFVWLTRGRLWIGLLGALLVGIVGLNVMALSFSASSSNAGQAADALKRSNSALRAQIAGRLSNSEIQSVAAKLDLVMPAPGDIGYLQSSADDAEQAAERLRNGELVIAGSTVPVEVAPVDTAPVETAPATDPAATTDPATVPVDPATTAPVETAAPPVAETTATAGAVGAP